MEIVALSHCIICIVDMSDVNRPLGGYWNLLKSRGLSKGRSEMSRLSEWTTHSPRSSALCQDGMDRRFFSQR